jgi:hypothetical protein
MRSMRMVAVGARTRTARLSALVGVALFACVLAGALSQAAQGEPMWTTYHRDPLRSGNDPDASNPITPTLAWQSPGLGAPIWGQPLALGSRVYVATVGDKIYALDASTGKVVWEKTPGAVVPSGELPCGDISPTVGIVGTPVIDTSTQVIYAVADTWNASTKEAHHVLKGYSLTGGEEVLSTAVDPPGSDPKALLQRTALNLDAGRVVFGFGGNDGDCGEYRGTVVAAPESGGSPLYWRYQPAPPSKSGGAVWGPSGPAVDGEGHIYASTGNPNPQGGKAETYDYSDSVVELSPSLSQIGNFEPESWLQDSNDDADLGSAGPEPLPGGLLFQAGKNRMGYLIDETRLGEGAPAVYSHQVCGGGGSFGGDAYANGTIYVPCTDGVRALSYNQAARTFTALWQGPSDANGPPIVSGGLVWSVATGGGGGTKLYGIDPSTGAPRYTVTLPSAVADHFASPSAAGGRLFVATGASVTAYQIAQLPPTATTGAASSITQTVATLKATVNPNGSQVSECKLEYGTTVSYASSVPCTPSPGSGTTAVAVSASVTGLTANTTYHFRISATNAGGTSKGSDETFTTLRGGLCGPSNSPGGQGTAGVCNWYSTKTIVPAGQQRVIFFYGGATSLVQTSPIGEMSCKTFGWGTIENPTGGGAGVGKILGISLYSCTAPQCEREVEEKVGKPGRATATPANLPWTEALSESGTPDSVRNHIGVPFSGPFGAPKAGEIDVKVVCEVIATKEQIKTTSFEGALEPEIGVGTGPPPGLNAASEFKFSGASAGALESPFGKGTYTGLLKYADWLSGTLEVW